LSDQKVWRQPQSDGGKPGGVRDQHGRSIEENPTLSGDQDDREHRRTQEQDDVPAPGRPQGSDRENRDAAEGRDRPPADSGRPRNEPWLGGG
jgi:hypothetical protein